MRVTGELWEDILHLNYDHVIKRLHDQEPFYFNYLIAIDSEIKIDLENNVVIGVS
jgi:hypothetical protein